MKKHWTKLLAMLIVVLVVVTLVPMQRAEAATIDPTGSTTSTVVDPTTSSGSTTSTGETPKSEETSEPPVKHRLLVRYLAEDSAYQSEMPKPYGIDLYEGDRYYVATPKVEGFTASPPYVTGLMPDHDKTLIVKFTKDAVEEVVVEVEPEYVLAVRKNHGIDARGVEMVEHLLLQAPDRQVAA